MPVSTSTVIGLLGDPAADAHRTYLEFAHELGVRLGRAGVGVVHGGVAAGMIGTVVRAALIAGSGVISFVPHTMLRTDVPPVPGCQVHVVRAHGECKRLVRRFADCFVVLPGGLDTLDQFGELIASRSAAGQAKPIVLANHGGYFGPLLSQLDRVVAEEFVTSAERNLIQAIEVADTVDGVLRWLTVFAERSGHLYGAVELPDQAQDVRHVRSAQQQATILG